MSSDFNKLFEELNTQFKTCVTQQEAKEIQQEIKKALRDGVHPDKGGDTEISKLFTELLTNVSALISSLAPSTSPPSSLVKKEPRPYNFTHQQQYRRHPNYCGEWFIRGQCSEGDKCIFIHLP